MRLTVYLTELTTRSQLLWDEFGVAQRCVAWRSVIGVFLRLPSVTLHFVPIGHDALSAKRVSSPQACFVRSLSHVLVDLLCSASVVVCVVALLRCFYSPLPPPCRFFFFFFLLYPLDIGSV